MKGIVTNTHVQAEKYVAMTEDEDFIGFLTSDIELSPGDHISGNLNSVASEMFKTGDGRQFSAYIEISGANRVTALAWMHRK